MGLCGSWYVTGSWWKRMSDHEPGAGWYQIQQGLRLDGLSTIDCKREATYLGSGSRGSRGHNMLPEQVTQASLGICYTPASPSAHTYGIICVRGPLWPAYGEATAWSRFTVDWLVRWYKLHMECFCTAAQPRVSQTGVGEIPLMNRFRSCIPSPTLCRKRSGQR